jgi:hypothetical protein
MVICLVFVSLFTIEGEQGFLNKFWISLDYKVYPPFSHSITTFIIEILLGGEKRKRKRMKGKANYQICLF